MSKSKHICADASVGIAYASLHAGNPLQSKSYDLMLADALNHYTSVNISRVRSSNELAIFLHNRRNLAE